MGSEPDAEVTAKVVQVILKPAEATPMTALALAALAQRAGIPDGVLNIVVGDPKAIGGVSVSGVSWLLSSSPPRTLINTAH